MLRSFSNPRILFPLVFGIGLFWSVVWAYVDRPRLHAGFGGIGDTILVRQHEFNDVVVRGSQFRDELDKRLKSVQFMAALSTADARQPQFFPEQTPVSVRHVAAHGLDVQPFVAEAAGMASDAFKGESLAFIVAEAEKSDLYVMYLYPRCYSVYRPGNGWIRWLQAHLPGMPDEARLVIEAEAGNQTVKDGIRKIVQRTLQECALCSKQSPTPPAR